MNAFFETVLTNLVAAERSEAALGINCYYLDMHPGPTGMSTAARAALNYTPRPVAVPP